MTNETVADIIAEKRREANYIVQVAQGKCHTRRDKAEDEARDIRREADRLEAAHRRERGDCAKLREALKFIKQYFDKIDPFNINTYTFSQIEVEHINEAIDAALAAPPRNCDVGTAEEQEKRFHDFCRARHLPRMEDSSYCAYKCPLEGGTCCELQWAQMPYEEGGSK